MMTISNKSERNDRGKCLGWPFTSYGPDICVFANLLLSLWRYSLKTKSNIQTLNILPAKIMPYQVFVRSYSAKGLGRS